MLVGFFISSHGCCTCLPRASEANYGGRVTDAHDRITISNLVTDFYCEDILKERLEGGFSLPKFSLYIALPCLADLLRCMPRCRVKRKNGTDTLVFTLCQRRTATSSLSCDLSSCHRFGENCYRSLLFLHVIFLASSIIWISGLAHIMLPSSNRWMAIWNISKLCPSTRCQRQVWGLWGDAGWGHNVASVFLNHAAKHGYSRVCDWFYIIYDYMIFFLHAAHRVERHSPYNIHK